MTPTGLLAATLTGYDPDGRVDLGRTRQHYERLLERGVNGFFVGGTTGESLLQTLDERREVLRHARDVLGGRATWVAHVGCIDTASTVELAREASALEADAIAVVTPMYFELDEAALTDHFRAVAAAAERPLFAYHIPSRSGVALSADFFVGLAEEGVIQGLKYTWGDLSTLAAVVRRTPADFVVLNGADDVLAGGLALGAQGGIGSTYTICPEIFQAVYDAMRRGDVASAQKHQHRANGVIAEMGKYDFLAFLREVLAFTGIDLGRSRRPLPSLTDHERDAIKTWALAHADHISPNQAA